MKPLPSSLYQQIKKQILHKMWVFSFVIILALETRSLISLFPQLFSKVVNSQKIHYDLTLALGCLLVIIGIILFFNKKYFSIFKWVYPLLFVLFFYFIPSYGFILLVIPIFIAGITISPKASLIFTVIFSIQGTLMFLNTRSSTYSLIEYFFGSLLPYYGFLSVYCLFTFMISKRLMITFRSYEKENFVLQETRSKLEEKAEFQSEEIMSNKQTMNTIMEEKRQLEQNMISMKTSLEQLRNTVKPTN